MPKFRKKPIVIEAHQWHKNGDHPADHDPIGHAKTARRRQGMVVINFEKPEEPPF